VSHAFPPVDDLWIGTYSSASSRGLIPLQSEPITQVPYARPPEVMIENASFAVSNLHHNVYYIVDERDEGRIGTWWRSAMGVWRRMDMVSTRGAAPCHLAISADGMRLAVANYDSGSVSVFPVDPHSGLLKDKPVLFENSGKGHDPERQNGPHAHCVCFAHGLLFSTDLGTDQVFSWPLATVTTTIGTPTLAFTAPAGEGPRQLLFNQTLPVAYLLTELGSRLYTLDLDASGHLISRGSVSTLPADFEVESLAGHLALNAAGDRLYASNRGHDSLAVFEVTEAGDLQPLGIYPTYGRSPRHFVLLEDRGIIVLAHQNGNSVEMIRLQPDGNPGDLIVSLPVHQPAFIGEAQAKSTLRRSEGERKKKVAAIS
jgi:6-phosphogluconolactonase